MKNQFKVLCGAVAIAMAGQVFAQTTWTLTGTPTTGVTIATYANTGGTQANANLQTVETAIWISSYGGIINNDKPANGAWSNGNTIWNGTCSSAQTTANDCDLGEGAVPEHAIDNNQRNEMVLLTFGSSVKLSNVKFGWTGTSNYTDSNGKIGDSDYTVMAYTGGTVPPSSLTVGAWSAVGATGSGWSNIGNYSDAITGVNNAINSGNVYSSYWLIGAYNPLANPNGGSVTAPATGGGSAFDYVKLASVTGTIKTVPEPGSLVLFGIALLGMLTLRKRQQA